MTRHVSSPVLIARRERTFPRFHGQSRWNSAQRSERCALAGEWRENEGGVEKMEEGSRVRGRRGGWLEARRETLALASPLSWEFSCLFPGPKATRSSAGTHRTEPGRTVRRRAATRSALTSDGLTVKRGGGLHAEMDFLGEREEMEEEEREEERRESPPYSLLFLVCAALPPGSPAPTK